MTKFYAAVREISPSPDQIQTLQRHIGSVRFVQNWCLDYVKSQLESNEKQSWSSISLHTAWRQHREEIAPWYVEVSKEALQFGCERASKGLLNFTKNRKHFKFPKYRKRGRNDSVSYTAASLKSSTLIHIPRVGKIALKEDFNLPENTRITIVYIREKAGRWFITFKLRDDSWNEPVKVKISSSIALDAGIGDRFCIDSSGKVIENPRYFRQSEQRLSFYQKQLSKKEKGSSRRKRVKKHIQRLHFKISNQRKDFIHKFTTALVKTHDEIVIENLALAGMKSKRGFRLGKSVSDVAWSEVHRQLEYKSSWCGKTLTIVDRFFPSSKLCSNCGFKNIELKLSDREWICISCNTKHDRDFNAALNLLTQSSQSDLAGSSLVSAHGEISSTAGSSEPVATSLGEVRNSVSFDIRI